MDMAIITYFRDGSIRGSFSLLGHRRCFRVNRFLGCCYWIDTGDLEDCWDGIIRHTGFGDLVLWQGDDYW